MLQKDTSSSSGRKKKHRDWFDHEDDEPPNNTPKQLTIHFCRLQDLLKPEIDILEARVLTLDLGL